MTETLWRVHHGGVWHEATLHLAGEFGWRVTFYRHGTELASRLFTLRGEAEAFADELKAEILTGGDAR